MSPAKRLLLLACAAWGCAAPSAPAQGAAAPAASQAPGTQIRFGDPLELAYDAPFFPGAHYDAHVPTASALLGVEHGTRLSRHDELLRCLRAWDDASERVTVETFGRTHEGRELVYAVITSPANQGRLADILANRARLHDPRGLSEADGRALADGGPAVAWMGYSVHGDELSGCDAALALAYHLAASTDDEVRALLERVVVVIDPCMNPDGRQRILTMVEQSAGYTPNLDYASMHRGRWPHGRGNHYLFDMNRDWMTGTQPETEARWRALLRFHPDLLVDAHEMGAQDTFLFYPQEKPLNPFFGERHAFWHGAFAEDAAHAFDSLGWAFYTREWADGWAPFYSDAWASLTGAIGILYEQAGTQGFPVRRASGQVLTYRESVHHQATASLANLRTLAARAPEVMADHLANQRRNVAAETPGNERTFVLVPGRNAARERELLRILLGQGIECFTADAGFSAAHATGTHGEREDARALPAGSVLVPARQPQSQLVKSFLTFDLRLDEDALKAEREELEQTGATRIYDLTAWSLPHAFDLDTWWCDAPGVAATPLASPPPRPAGGISAAEPEAVAWAVDASDDAALVFALRALEAGLAVHASDRPFTTGGRTFPRGSFLVRRRENEGTAEEISARVDRAARAAGVAACATSAGRSPDDGPDLGGQRFHLLARPRVAMLANAPVDEDTYGHLWHYLDVVLGVPFTLLDAQAFAEADLRRYNVLIVPPGGGAFVSEQKEGLKAWVESGGTLIAVADAAGAATEVELASTKLREDALGELEDYAEAAARERAAFAVQVDAAAVWDGPSAATDGATADAEDEDQGDDEDEAPTEEEDARLKLFAPYGVTLLSEVHPRHWITAGTGPRMPVFFSGERAFLARAPVATAVRLAPGPELRLGGLLWPEARARIADSAWLTVEARGSGEVVLFACMPAYRGYHAATARLLGNAVVLGPGLGASQPLDW